MGSEFNMNSIVDRTINQSVIREPSDTIVYGEKLYAVDHYYMDFLEGQLGNDFEVLNHSVHNKAARTMPLRMAARVTSSVGNPLHR